MSDELTLKLSSPLTEEEMDLIMDYDLDHTSRIWFHTKHGKSVEFVKAIRCKDCKYSHMTYDGDCKYCDIWFPDDPEYMPGDYYCGSAERREDA